jgi:hypothetical protein
MQLQKLGKCVIKVSLDTDPLRVAKLRLELYPLYTSLQRYR